MSVAEFAAEAHKGQTRYSGAAFITHPIAVASIVSEWKLDDESITAALLHDVVEDTECTVKDIESRFGQAIAQIVNGVSKIEKIEQFESDRSAIDHTTAGTYRKLLLAISQDWRVILIKLADRLHNMRTLSNIRSRAKRRRIAKETLEIYAPIAERLGLQQVRDELQSISFEHIYPLRYAVINSAMERSQESQRKAIPKIKRSISASLREAELKTTIKLRSKNIYSVYSKMIEKDLEFSEVHDIIGFRIITKDLLDCYTVLGVVHSMFRPVPDKLKDYIAQPKPNGYQSLHTTVLAQNGSIIELQIRTDLMDNFAEKGVAAHWSYKEKGVGKQKHAKLQAHTNRQLNTLYTMSGFGVEPGDYLRNLRLDLYPNDIFALTPSGEIIQLKRGATVLDMAYAIHSEMGSKADYAMVNGHRMPISAPLSSGDIVNVFTDDKVSPNPKWLTFSATSKARVHIRNQLKTESAEELVSLGRSLLARALRRGGYSEDSIDDEKLNQYLRHNVSISSIEEFYSQIALGIYLADVMVKEILGGATPQIAKEESLILLSGNKHAGIIRAECCQPLPPEKIVGVMQRNSGLIVHRHDCSQVANVVKHGKHVAMAWGGSDSNSSYQVNLNLECTNRKGLLANVFSQFSLEDVNVVNINMDGAENSSPSASIKAVVEVKDLNEIERLIRRINWIKGVTVSRVGASPTPLDAQGSQGATGQLPSSAS